MKTDLEGEIFIKGASKRKGLVSLMEDVICETKPEHDINRKSNSGPGVDNRNIIHGNECNCIVVGVFLEVHVNNTIFLD